jgi:hypothetical protein
LLYFVQFNFGVLTVLNIIEDAFAFFFCAGT